MKNTNILIAALALSGILLTAAGCGGGSSVGDHTANSQTAVEQILSSSASGTEAAAGPSSSPEEGDLSGASSENGEKPASEKDVSPDVDLKILSSTMVYSEVYNMMVKPSEYKGKTVKMRGSIAFQQDKETGKRYYACIIQDTTACCSQGIEFEPTEEFVYPDDFPKEGETVTVVGTFDTYTEGDYQYNSLRNATLL